MSKYIVELEKGVWKADIQGDPGRTIVKRNAKKFKTKIGAEISLSKSILASL